MLGQLAIKIRVLQRKGTRAIHTDIQKEIYHEVHTVMEGEKCQDLLMRTGCPGLQVVYVLAGIPRAGEPGARMSGGRRGWASPSSTFLFRLALHRLAEAHHLAEGGVFLYSVYQFKG